MFANEFFCHHKATNQYPMFSRPSVFYESVVAYVQFDGNSSAKFVRVAWFR